MKRYGVIVIISLLLSLLFMTFMFTELNILAVINSVSMAALLLLTIGALLFVIEGGVFYGMAYSFKRFFRKTALAGKTRDEFAEDENEDDFRRKTYSFRYTYPFLIIGGVLFLLSLVIAYSL